MDASTSPDPVSEPKAYQDHLLSLLGDDDPAEVQAGTAERWRALLEDAGERGHERPAHREWSVVGCLGHAVDAEVVSAARYRWILAHDDPPLIGYDQDLWADRLHGDAREDPEELLRLFEPLRVANLALWARSSDEDRARIGIHAERGPESFDLLFRMIAGHDRFHLAQARRALDAIAGG
ncbi:MAG TPA: DinB family protein [Actinomycetota bacterium]|nr:DinB family protein [Actinomycetota bacterium]